MTRRARILLIIAAMLAPIAIYGVTGGGFPSRPTFQSVKVNGNTTTGSLTTGSVTNSGASSAASLNVTGTTTLATLNATQGNFSALSTYPPANSAGLVIDGLANQSPYITYSSGGTIVGYAGVARGPNSLTTGASSGDMVFRVTANSILFSANGGNSVNFGISNTGISVNGLAVPKVSYVQCGAAGGMASVAKSNVTSCVQNGTGSYVLTFTTGYTGTFPTCVGSAAAGAGTVTNLADSFTQVGIATYNPAGTQANLAFNISCFGT